MTDRVERMVVDELARRLASNWLEDYKVSGVKAFLKVESEREAIIAEAKRLNLYDAVYNKAKNIFHGVDQ